MEIEDNSDNLNADSPLFSKCKFLTPQTLSNDRPSNSHNQIYQTDISQFSLQLEVACLSRMMSHMGAQQKQNEKHTTDRFIPLRKFVTKNSDHFAYLDVENDTSERGQEMKEYKMTLDQMYRSLLLEKDNNKILKFGGDNGNGHHLLHSFQQQKNYPHHSKKMINQTKLQRTCSNPEYRKVPKVPFKVLDAPNLQDDFYLNLLQWSSQNILSVALDSSLYFWNANNNRVLKFCDLNPDSISSISWNQLGSQIAVGTSKGTIEIWDVAKSCKINQYVGHSARVSSIAWSQNVLASGSRDRTINLRDIRERSNQIYIKYQGHTQQVCGLKWSFDSNLLASGGNDNKLFIWSPYSQMPISKFSNHCAAVKGIAWSPHNHGVLASGGGSADKTIKFWNTLDNSLIDSIDTGSQVCNIIFSKNTKELVSTHGYSNNQIIIWKYPTLQKLSTLTGHTSRVLFLAMNPSGETIVTGAGDQTLRFWSVFPSKLKKEHKSNVLSTLDLR